MMTRETGRQIDVAEVVGVFDNPEALYAAIDELQTHGFNRSELCMLADEAAVEEKLGKAFWHARDLEDEPDAPRQPYFSEESIGAIEGAAISAPLYVAAVATAGVLVTPAGSMLTAIAAAILAGGVGAAIGGLLAARVGESHAEYLANQMRHGGLLLWVRAPDEARQEKAKAIMIAAGGRDVHAHAWSTPD
jgi:hypothetical protein